MKVLLWSQYFWPENFRINDLAKALHDKGVEVTVLTGKPNYPDGKVFPGYTSMGIKHEKYSGIEVIRIPLVPRGKASSFSLMMNYLSFVFSGFFIAPFVLRNHRFDAVFVYAPSPLLQAIPAIFISWLKRAPLILWVQDLWPDALRSTGHISNRFLLWLIEQAVRYVYRSSDSILIQSEGFRSSVESLVACKKKIRFYPNSADDALSELPKTVPNIGLAKDIREQFSIVFAGNIGSAQSCETIVAAAKLLQGVQGIKFYLVGDGSMANAVAESIAFGALTNIVMTGRIPACDMPSIYASASVLLLTLRDDPGLSATIPSKLQSYLAAGKPIVASCNGESADVVKRAEAGLSCHASDAGELAKAVLELYGMEADELARFGENGRKYFMANFYLPTQVVALITHLKEIVH